MDFNASDFMKNIKNMQNEIKETQSKLKLVTASGTSGGGLVKIEINGELEVQKIEIDPIAVDPRDINMLQDLIIAAMNSAQANIKEKIAQEVGMNKFNMPFDFGGIK